MNLERFIKSCFLNFKMSKIKKIGKGAVYIFAAAGVLAIYDYGSTIFLHNGEWKTEENRLYRDLGKKLPATNLPDINPNSKTYNRSINLSDLENGLILFVEDGCAPCEVYIPVVDSVVNKYNLNAVCIIPPGESKNLIKKKLKSVKFPILKGDIKLNVRLYPTTYFVENGIIDNGIQLGQMNFGDLEAKVLYHKSWFQN